MDKTLTFNVRDEFKRKIFADQLCQLLFSRDNVTPIVIDGDWGTGKTEFCIKVFNEIKLRHSDKAVPFYFDAFAEDYFDDPLVSLLCVFYNEMPDAKTKKKFLEKGAQILKNTSQIVVQSFLNRLIGEHCPDLSKLPEALLSNEQIFFEKIFEQRAQVQGEIDSLMRLIEQNTKDKDLVLFIDELDRCRPDYTVHFWEAIKHFLQISRLKIVFIANLEQVQSSIHYAYGISEERAKKYLDKFYKLRLRLPETVLNESGERKTRLAAAEYYTMQCQLLQEKELLMTQPLHDFMKELIEVFQLSLRDVEKLIFHMKIFLPLFDNWGKMYTGYQLMVLFAIFSTTREAYWIPELILKESVTPDIGEGFEKQKVERYRRTVLQQFSDCLFADSDKVSHLFNHWALSIEDREKFLVSVFKKINEFEKLIQC